MTRYKTRAKALAPTGASDAVRQRPSIDWLRRSVKLAYWNEEYVTRDSILDRVLKLVARNGQAAVVDAGWNDYDLEIRANPWTRIELKTADEEHEGTKLKNHVLARIKLTRIAKLALAAGAISAAAVAIAGLPELALGLGALTMAGAVCVAGEMVGAGRVAYRAVEACAAELNLTPLGKPVRELAGAEVTVDSRRRVGARLAAQERISE